MAAYVEVKKQLCANGLVISAKQIFYSVSLHNKIIPAAAQSTALFCPLREFQNKPAGYINAGAMQMIITYRKHTQVRQVLIATVGLVARNAAFTQMTMLTDHERNHFDRHVLCILTYVIPLAVLCRLQFEYQNR